MMSTIMGPHAALNLNSPAEEALAVIFDRLWERYVAHVPYAAAYAKLAHEQGITFVNDHIAFRTIAHQQPASGIAALSRIFEALGYVPSGNYLFPDKHLAALHFQHPNPDLPKLFISELQSWKLSPASQNLIHESLATHSPWISSDLLSELAHLTGSLPHHLLDHVVSYIHTLPWDVSPKETVLKLNTESQYGAWVLVHGFNVNHFTASINAHGDKPLGDIENTVACLRERGVPMKATIEGERGSKLRQTATAAVEGPVLVAEGSASTIIPWSYAYFELAERGNVVNPETGATSRFEGFLGGQATHLFEMTRRT